MHKVLEALQQRPLQILLVFVPIALVLERTSPDAHTALFLCSVAAIIPLAVLMSRATESIAARTGDLVGGLLNATLGNLTEMVIALTALRAGMHDLVKASLAGAIVTNLLFMLGAAFLLGGIRHHVQEFNRVTARVQSGMMMLAAFALIVPAAMTGVEGDTEAFFGRLSAGLSILLLAMYALSNVFTFVTHRELFVSKGGEHHEGGWSAGVAVGVLVAVTIGVAMVAEVLVGSVGVAAENFGMSQAFAGFIVVSLVGGAAEMASAFSAARQDRLDMSVGIAMGSSTQIALFVAPALVLLSHFIGPEPMDLRFEPGHVIMVLLATMAGVLVTNNGRSAWYSGVQLLAVYGIFAVTLYLLP
jgi:Ca2+:H+ antiporter